MDYSLQLPKKKYVLIYSLTGSLLTTIVPILVAADHLRENLVLLRIVDIVALFGLVLSIFYLSFWLNIKIHKVPVYKLLIANFLAFGVLTLASISIHWPIWKITTHIPVVFYIRDEIVRNFTIFIVSYLAAKFYIKNAENQKIKTAFDELQNENLTNQIQGLMQQINPHFFFNTLNTLSGLVQESPEKSEVFIDKLSQVFRYVLKMQENSKALLSDELKFAEDYFYLIKMRFDDKIFLDFEIEKHEPVSIAPLSSQLLIENVIKHNRMNRHLPVKIQMKIENDYLVVSNTYYPQQSANSTGLGLRNLNKRCELLCGKSIIIEQTDQIFCVKVPLIKA